MKARLATWSLFVAAIGLTACGGSKPSLPITSVPDAPTGAAAVAGTLQATVSWTAPTNDGGSPITSYTVTTSPSGARVTVAAPATSTKITGLKGGGSYTFTVIAKNGIGDSAPSSPSKAVTVKDVAPSDLTYSMNPAVYTKGTAITADMPSSSGGAVVSYSVSPGLPAGLSLDTSTGVISGTPTAMTAQANYTVTAANSGGATTAKVTITVNDAPPSGLTYSTNPAVYTKGTAITEDEPSTSGGGTVVSYSVSPALPAGLSFDTATGIISGTPTSVTSRADYTVTATNSGGSTTATVTITVNNVAPSGLTYSMNPAVYTKGTATTDDKPSTSGGGPVVSYSVSPTLPAGLSLETGTGVISGTPTAVAAQADYTVTATNSGGSTTATVTLTVNDVAPSGLTYSTNPASYPANRAIAKNTPSASSGGAVVSYSVSPTLPAGLSLDTSTGVISGTPTAVTARADYTVTAINSGGSTTDAVSIAITGSPDASTSTLTASDVPADGTTTMTITLVVKDSAGNTLSGQSVTSLTSSVRTDSLTPSSGTTDSSGQFVATVAASSLIGMRTFTAKLGSISVTGTGTFTAPVCTVPPLTFSNPANPFVHTHPYSVTRGDFNGDGKLDLAVANYSSNDVSVLLNKGDGTGTFQTAANYGVGSLPQSVASGDFNGDGKPDLAVANFMSNDVSVLLNKGDGTGTFQTATMTNYGVGTYPVSVAVGDFNGDGKPDLAVASEDYTVSVLLNKGDGTGAFLAAAAYGGGVSPMFLTVGDFNEDGKPDLAVADASSTNNVSVLLNKGDGTGTFQTATSSDVSGAPYSVTSGDFNGDGNPDLAVVSVNNTVGVLLGKGNGTFQPVSSYDVGSFPNSVTSGDFNGDGKPDLIVANTNSNDVSVLLGIGDGKFQTAQSLSVGSSPISVTSGDFNGDGNPDLAVVNFGDNDVSVLLNQEPSPAYSGTFQPTMSPNVGSDPNSVTSGDFNGDGKPDLAVANWGSNTVSMLLGNGYGTFDAAVDYGVGSGPTSVTSGDFNGDGKPDLAVANSSSNTVSVLLENETRTFDAAVDYGVGSGPTSVMSGDFNGDGKPDLAVANYSSLNVSVLLGDGTGKFQAATNYGVAGFATSVTIGDFNGDGKPDLAVADSMSDSVSVLLNKGDGTGTFQAAANYGAVTDPLFVTSGDFNGDGKPDLAVADGNGSDSVSVFLNTGDGTGTFQAAQSYGVGVAPVSVTSGDFNGDGKPDLATSNEEDNTVSVLLNTGDGTGTFQAFQGYGAGYMPYLVVSADFNGDGRPDLAIANQGDNVSVLLNTGCAP